MSELEMMLFGMPHPIPNEIVRVVIDAHDWPPPKKRSRDIVIDLLESENRAVCIDDIAEKTGIQRSTLRATIRKLVSEKKVRSFYMRDSGSRKMFAQRCSV